MGGSKNAKLLKKCNKTWHGIRSSSLIADVYGQYIGTKSILSVFWNILYISYTYPVSIFFIRHGAVSVE